jgi:hypothetical protein
MPTVVDERICSTANIASQTSAMANIKVFKTDGFFLGPSCRAFCRFRTTGGSIEFSSEDMVFRAVVFVTKSGVYVQGKQLCLYDAH